MPAFSRNYSYAHALEDLFIFRKLCTKTVKKDDCTSGIKTLVPIDRLIVQIS